MLKLISVKEALSLEDTVIIDVRSPAEFEEATIPGAVNMPVLEDVERAIVGKAYRHESVEKATTIGIGYASQKLSNMYKAVSKYQKENKNVIVFCWRGGMRSKSVCTFLNSLKLNVYQLKGGYKAYRRYVRHFLANIDHEFIVLHGLTGVGKTHILMALEKEGEPVLDLEELAKNSGSVFGNILFDEKPPSQKMFESYIFNVLYYEKRKVIFVESESKRIGHTQIPDTVYKNIVEGHHILIHTPLSNRINIIKEDYLRGDYDDQLIEAITHLRKRLGNNIVEELINKIYEKNYEFVIQTLIEKYYDPLYQYSINQYKEYDLKLEYDEIKDILPELIEYGKRAENKIERKK